MTTLAVDGVAFGSLPSETPAHGPVGLWTSHAGISAMGVSLTALAE